ncbi:MAG: response regulator [Deltaproteobacteria bacterium]|nr:response regulator [Deltaproteobacteria bacterium]
MEPPKILVIDDEEISRISCERILRRLGVRVQLAATGRAGLDILMREPHDLVLVDFKMPEMDGMEVTRRIREFDPEIVTIVITGYATIESAVTVMKEGAYDYLPKPFTPDELLIVVKRGLEKRRLDQESKALREEKEAMERNFVTLVSHQLRSPLSAVYQYIEVLLSSIAGELNAAQQEMLERIRERLDGLLQLTNDWLDMSRIQAGEIVNRLKADSVMECVKSALSALELAAQQRQIKIDVQIPGDLPPVHLDRDTLREALSNLISNAIKYNRIGGEVRIRAEERDDWVVVECEDTGFGVDEKEIPFIFDQFYRGKAREVREQQGTGLGLAIVHRIVRAHGGKIEVRSQPGKGSTFSVYLNRAKDNGSSGQPEHVAMKAL